MYAHRVYMTGRRSFTRKKCYIPVDYVLNQKVYRDFIEDISSVGAFIACKQQPDPGDPVVVVFTIQQPIKSRGKVIRTTENGFAVQFQEPVALQ